MPSVRSRRWLRLWQALRQSPRLHVRETVRDLREAIAIIDRFLDGEPAYDLEWDDFVSWAHDDPRTEALRGRIAASEPLFFSGRDEDLTEAIALVTRERDRAAAQLGLPPRGAPA